MLTDKQRTFCRRYVACGQAKQAAIDAGYSAKAAKQEGSRLLKQRQIHEEIERLQAAIARTGNEIMAKAIATTQADPPPELPNVDPDLARSLVARRGADDEARAVVSMAYVMAGMIEGLEMALGRQAQVESLKKTRTYKDEDTGDLMREETIVEVKVFRTDLGAAKGLASELAKILLPASGEGQDGQTIEAITEERRAYINRLLAAYHEGEPPPPIHVEPRKT